MNTPKTLMIDVGGTNVKLMASGQEGFRRVRAGRGLTGSKLVKLVEAEIKEWRFDRISLGFPGAVQNGEIAGNPQHLGSGWKGYDFAKSFGCPVRIMNGFAMQALANYESGRLLYFGLGTSVGAAIVADDTIIPLEIGSMPISKSEAFMDRLDKEGRKAIGPIRWQKSVRKAVRLLKDIFDPQHFQIGGGNAKHLDPVPEGCELLDRQDAFRGAIRLWPGEDFLAEAAPSTWKLVRNKTGEK